MTILVESVSEGYLTGVSHKSVPGVRHQKVSYKTVPAVSLKRISEERLRQKCVIMMGVEAACVLSLCFIRVGGVYQVLK